jgi:predicted CoA-binding protein
MASESATSTPEPGPVSRALEFLTSRRIALVGFSRSPKDFSRLLDREFRRLGIDVVQVHPSAAAPAAAARRLWPCAGHEG